MQFSKKSQELRINSVKSMSNLNDDTKIVNLKQEQVAPRQFVNHLGDYFNFTYENLTQTYGSAFLRGA